MSDRPVVLINALSGRSGGAVAYLREAVPRVCERLDVDGRCGVAVLADVNQAAVLREAAPRSEGWIKELPTAELSGVKRAVWERKNLPRIAEDLGAAVVFTPYQVLNVQTTGRQVIMVRNMEPFFHGRYPYRLRGRLRNRLLAQATLRSVRAADSVIAVSDFVKTHLAEQRGMEPDKIPRVYHGRDESLAATPEVMRAERKLDILTCGSLLPYRRCEDVIQGFAEAARAPGLEDAQLQIAGQGTEPGYLRRLKQCAATSGVEDRVVFLGHVDRETMRTLYQRCRACVIATEIEACPNIAIEALTSGCHVIAADNPPLPEILGGAGVLYPPRNIGALAHLIHEALGKPEQICESRQKAVERAEAFSWDRCADETCAVLLEQLN